MAVVEQPHLSRQRNTFNSVFPSGSVRPPKNRKQFETNTNRSEEHVCNVLTHDSRIALGIEEAEFEYGSSVTTDTNISIFSTYYPRSALVESLAVPSTRDESFLLKRFERLETWRSLPSWRSDLGDPRLKKLFASVIDKLLTTFVEWSYSQSYGSGVLEHLNFWIRHIVLPYVSHFLAIIDGHNEQKKITTSDAQLEKWQEMAITRLATLRVDELFGIIIEWDESAPGIDDLKHYTTNPATRSYVTSSFANVINTRLLHPGASTIEILQVYISIIRAFRRLDPKGVLLERVARKLRRYLREREDTIKIVVAGLLSDFELREDEQTLIPNPEVLTELAYELQLRESDDARLGGGGNELDWNNMEWVPDPIDAAPDYLRSMSTDVIGSIISLFESKDIFVRELQTALAERLLHNKHDFDQEISVVEHLKIRFGDNALQGCEVMLRDVLDSRKLDQVIRQDQGLDIAATAEMEDDNPNTEISLHAKILSRLFWPALPEQPFTVPLPILEQRNRYEKGFESLKQTRKLTWNDAIGHVEVELDLEDRTFQDEVLPYQATVIYAFQHDEEQSSALSSSSVNNKLGTTRTTANLATDLSMAPALVRSACMFWVSKRILTQVRLDVFAVLETLPSETGPTAAGANTGSTATTPTRSGGRRHQAHPSPGVGGGSSSSARQQQQNLQRDIAAEVDEAATAAAEAIRAAEAAERKQKLQIYHQFIVAMLTNRGATPLPQIAMMLGMVVPGGFPFSNEELREFLAGMVRDGVLEVGAGGNYKIAT